MTAPAASPQALTTGAFRAYSRARIEFEFDGRHGASEEALTCKTGNMPGSVPGEELERALPGSCATLALGVVLKHRAGVAPGTVKTFPGASSLRRNWPAAPGVAFLIRKSGRSSWPDATQDEFPAKPLPGAAPINARRFSNSGRSTGFVSLASVVRPKPGLAPKYPRRFSRMTFSARHAAKPMRSKGSLSSFSMTNPIMENSDGVSAYSGYFNHV